MQSYMQFMNESKSIASPTYPFGKVAVTLFILALQSVLHLLKLVCRASANARLTGNCRPPELKLIVIHRLSSNTARRPMLLLFLLIFFFLSGCLSLCSLFVFIFLFLKG